MADLTLDQVWMYLVGGNPDDFQPEPDWMEPGLFKAKLLAEMTETTKKE